MNTVKTVLKWLLGISLFFSGIGSLPHSPIIGILIITISFFIIPLTLKLIEDKADKIFPSAAKWVFAIGGLFLVGLAASGEAAANDSKIDKLVVDASGLIDSGEIEDAKGILIDAKSKYSTPNNKARDLEIEISNSQSIDFAKEQLVLLTDEEFEKLEKGNLEKQILSQKTLNKNLIAEMQNQAPERAAIIKEVAEKKEQERIAAEMAEERRKQEELNKNRAETIEKQFSAWDGSHPALSRMIKKSMNDPDSYEHIETRFRDDKTSIFVITKFRGANAFGGKVINNVSARVDFEGNVIEIVSQN